MRFGLGERVTITGTARKVKTFIGFSRGHISWQEGDLPVRHNWPEPKQYNEGVIVGQRTVMDGTAHYDEGAMFDPSVGSARNVWLVAFDMRMKPAVCFDHQVEPQLTEASA